jgi:hypothetical protein
MTRDGDLSPSTPRADRWITGRVSAGELSRRHDRDCPRADSSTMSARRVSTGTTKAGAGPSSIRSRSPAGLGVQLGIGQCSVLQSPVLGGLEQRDEARGLCT